MGKAVGLAFANGRTALAIRVRRSAELPAALRELGLDSPRRTIVLVGGAGGLSDVEVALFRPLFDQALAPLAEALGAAVVDGGTDAGVMQLVGQARADAEANFSLIGVSAVGTVALPGVADPHGSTAPLEPHHSHFLLVPGSRWGDESPWLSQVATALADGAPSVTVVVNGGEVTREDVARSIEAGRPVLALAGSGRAADELADALGGAPAGERARQLVGSGLLRAVDLAAGSRALAKAIEAVLASGR
jgi:hypothetical protein